MLRVLGTSGDSVFHRESLSEEVKIKTESGIQAPAKEGSSQTLENEGSPDRQSFGRGLDDNEIKRKISCTNWKKISNFLLRSIRGPPQIALQSAI